MFSGRSTLSVIAAYLDAFQKIADAATSAKGEYLADGLVPFGLCTRLSAGY